MPDEIAPEDMAVTQIELSKDLRDRIMAQAKADRRTIRPEMVVLLEEAVTARERRK